VVRVISANNCAFVLVNSFNLLGNSAVFGGELAVILNTVLSGDFNTQPSLTSTLEFR